MGTVTIDNIKAIIQGNYDREVNYITLYNEVLEILAKYEGQQPTKRIATAIQKTHPDYIVYWRNEYGMYHLDIWGGNSGFEYQHHPSFLIAYHSRPIVDIEAFKEHNTCYGNAAMERNNLRESMLNDTVLLDNIVNAINTYNQSHELIASIIQYPMPDQYDIEKLANNYRKY